MFFLAGLVESWGRGVQKILTECKLDGIDEPTYRVSGSSLLVEFTAPEDRMVRTGGRLSESIDQPIQSSDQVGDNTDQVTDLVHNNTEQVTGLASTSVSHIADPVQRLINALGDREMSITELMQALGLRHRPSFRERDLDPALARDLVERTIPDKPTSSKQRYRKTRR